MSKKKNSFSFFLDHYVDEQRKRKRNISKKLAAEECAPLWSCMSLEQKQVYIDLAKAYKSERDYQKTSPRAGSSRDQFISDPYSKGTLGEETSYLEAHISQEQDLKNHNFYFIHCNYYCQTQDGIYVPGEIALVEFNLEHGIKNKYHTLVDPGKIPLGYAYVAKKISEDVHGLPIPPHDKGETNFDRVLDAILHFIKPSEQKEGECPPLFTIEENIEPTKEILKKLCNRTNLAVYSISKMLYWLKNKCTEHCGVDSGFPALSIAMSEIEKDVFRYCTGLSCEFHSDDCEKYYSCSLSVVQRMVYVICDHCCRHLKIKLVRGKHTYYRSKLRESDENLSRPMRSGATDVASSDEESNYCGASTYASSVTVGCKSESKGKKLSDVEADDEVALSDTQAKSSEEDYKIREQMLLLKIRGRGRRIQNLQ